MRKLFKILIGIGATLLPIIVILILPILIFKQSLWWIGITLIIEAIIWIILGLVFLYLYIKKTTKVPEEGKIEEIIPRVIESYKLDEFNPDNLIPKSTFVQKVASKKSADITPVLGIIGWGSEKNIWKCAIINLKKPDEMTKLENTEKKEFKEFKKECMEFAIKIADNYEEIEELTTTTQQNAFGTTQVTKLRRPSVQEIQEQKQKEEAEAKNIL